MNIEKNTAVVIMSCDKYHDLWDPFFYFFEKHWPDCPYPVYLTSNSKTYSRKNILHVHSHLSSSWSEETEAALKEIPYEYIIYLQDDYFFLKDVDTLKVDNLIGKMKLHNADYLRIFPSPGPDASFKKDGEIGEINPDAEYRTSLQCAIWKRKTFIELLKPEENQWQFEINSPERSRNFLFLSVKNDKNLPINKQIFPITYFYLTAVYRGKWRWEALQICKSEGIKLDLRYRQAESFSQMLYRKMYGISPLIIKKSLDYIQSKIK